MVNALVAVEAVCGVALGQLTQSPIAQPAFPPTPTATEVMLRGLLAAGLYGLLGIALMLIGFKLFDAITPKIDVQKELAENKNVALAIVVAAMLIGLALMLGRVISA